NIEELIKGWYPVVERVGGDSRLVIIDDGSKDDTYDILKTYQDDHPLLKPLTKPNGGHGATVLYGYRYALKQKADYIFQTDSDGQTNPDEFEAFWKERENYDAILGNRTVRGDGKQRAFVEKTVCFLLRLVFGVKVPDANAPFRLMKADLVDKYIRRLPKNYNLPNIMFTTYFAYYHEKLLFKEISFKPRQAGVNSINVKKIVKIGWKAFWDFVQLRRRMK
ncbi:MAG: glycosyltransferase family 2 protein, partial [Eubacteriales bacterium]|nr:glycosyltransferase family 2 protein [Eubacteriales bacterium]